MAELPSFIGRQKASEPIVYEIVAEIPPEVWNLLCWFVDEFDLDWNLVVAFAIHKYLKEVLSGSTSHR